MMKDTPRPTTAPILATFVIAFVGLLLVLPIAYFGIPRSPDMRQHYQFAYTFYEALQSGDLYPSWPDANRGLGDVGTRFYPPFAYFVLSFLRWVSGGWYPASVIAFYFWFFLSGAGVYLWNREYFGINGSAAAAVVYQVLPYHVSELYYAFTYAEFAAVAVLPFCFLFVSRVCRRGDVQSMVGLAISYALLILTHIPMSVMGSIALGALGLLMLEMGKVYSSLTRLSISLIAGLAASSFYWLTVVTELNFVRHAEQQFASGPFNYASNFVLGFLFTSAEVYDGRTLWYFDAMLVMTFCFVLPSAWLYVKSTASQGKKAFIAAGGVFLLALFFATPLSFLIWENFGVLQKIQFPWRWLAVVSLAGSIFVAAGFDELLRVWNTDKRPIAILTLGLVLVGASFTITYVILSFVPAEIDRFERTVSNSTDVASHRAWWPVWAKNKGFGNKELASAGGREVEITDWGRESREFVVQPGEPMNVRARTFYYPHWKATVNGHAAEVGMDENGVITIPVSSEASTVRLYFEEPPANKIANAVSSATWLLALFLILAVYGSRLRSSRVLS